MRDDCMPTEDSSGCSLQDGPTFRKELEALLNKYSIDNDTNTPDFILAEYIEDCISQYAVAMQRRDQWYRN